MTDTLTHAAEKLDCGHDAKPGFLAAGYATLPGSERRVCYPCADAMQRAHMSVSNEFVAYVDSRGNLTTWTGGRLADYEPGGSVWRGGFNGEWICAWRFRDPSGAIWYGRNGGRGMVIRVRRSLSAR